MGWNSNRFFSVILFTTMMLVPATTDCPEYTYNIGSTQFTLPKTPSSDLWIATDCLDANKLLIFRRCENDNWIPNDNSFEFECTYENVELSSNDCPHESTALELQVPLPRTICVLNHSGISYNFIVDKSVCIEDNISTMDTELNIGEQTQLISKLVQQFTKYIFPLGARNRYPSKEISKNVNYDIEDVELHDVRCGRFGLPLKFNLPVYCTEDVCGNMCLSINATTEPFSRLIHECSDYVIAKAEDTFLHGIGCPKGYYRTENDYIQTGKPDSCFSIQMFPKAIPVEDLEYLNVIESYCNGTIMTLSWREDMFIFKKLSEQVELTDVDHCLFGLTSNEIIKFSDWNSTYASEINLFNFNWDKTMNYSRISDRDEVSYLTVKSNGQWTWAVSTVSCIVCMADVTFPIPNLQINYNVLERKLELHVTDQEFMYRVKSSDSGFICFSLYRDIYKANLTVSPVDDSVTKYVVEDVGIGQYWCNGHNVIRRRYISSEIIFAYGVWFAFDVVRKCDLDCSSSADDLSQFISLLQRNNGLVSVKDSLIVENKTTEGDSEYTFTAYLSLTSHSPISYKLLNDLVSLTDYQLETVYIHQHLNKSLAINDAGMNIKSIRSTEYCLHESTIATESIIWGIAKIGETIPISPLCHPKNITRKCSGDYVNGSFWEEPVGTPVCESSVSKSLLELYVNHSNSNSMTAVVIESVKNLLEDNIDILLPLDVFLTSRILQNVGNVTLDELQNIFSIFNSIMQVDENILKVSAIMNLTNVLLEALDNILMNRMKYTITGSSDYLLYGNTSIQLPLIETYFFDPRISGICGLALFRPRAAGNADVDFTIYSPLFVVPTDATDKLMNDKLADKDLVIGARLSKAILDYNNITVAMTVFFNSKLFQSIDESLERTFVKSNEKIVSVTIAGLYNNSNLPSKIQVYLESQRNENSKCGYWSFTTEVGSSWSSDGCGVREVFTNSFQQLTLCECSYLSHFGYLVDRIFEDDSMLTIISVLTASVSLFGTFGVFITAVVFPRWRQNASSKILINFAASITLEIVLTIWVDLNYGSLSVIRSSTLNCLVLGLILHYSVMVMFLWMLIIVYFQFSRYVVVFKFSVSYILLKLSIWIWGVSLFPVLVVLIADRSLYINKAQHKFCHPTGWALYFGVVSPITIIFVVVSVFTITALIDLRRRSSRATSQIEADKFRDGFYQIRLSAFLFLTLGLTWSFSLISKVISRAYLIHTYLFCITATIKGIALILYIIVVDGSVSSLWLTYFRKMNYFRKVHK